MARGSTGCGRENRCRRGESAGRRLCCAASRWAVPGRRPMAIAMGGGDTGGAPRTRWPAKQYPHREGSARGRQTTVRIAIPSKGAPAQGRSFWRKTASRRFAREFHPTRWGAFSRNDDLRAILCGRRAGLAFEPGREVGSIVESAVKRHRDDRVGRRRKQVHRVLEA